MILQKNRSHDENILTSGNGAAANWLRKSCRRHELHKARTSFNGAATNWLRKFCYRYESYKRRSNSLQPSKKRLTFLARSLRCNLSSSESYV